MKLLLINGNWGYGWEGFNYLPKTGPEIGQKRTEPWSDHAHAAASFAAQTQWATEGPAMFCHFSSIPRFPAFQIIKDY